MFSIKRKRLALLRATNTLGGVPWAGGSGDGGAGTFMRFGRTLGGPAGSGAYASVTGTMVTGSGSWGVFQESLPNRDLSSYTGSRVCKHFVGPAAR